MCKKIGIAAVAIILGVALIGGLRWSGSHVCMFLKQARESLRSQVSPERELARLQQEISKLDDDTAGHIKAIAKESVAVDNLRTEVTDLEAGLQKQKAYVLSLKEGLENGKTFVSLDGRPVSKERAQRDLERSWKIYMSSEAELDAKRNLLAERETGLENAKEELRSMQQAKRNLEVAVARLQAEVKRVRAAENRSNFHLDNSRLGQIKEDLKRVQDRVSVMKKELKLREELSTTPVVPADQHKKVDVLKEINEHFGKPAGDKEVVFEKK
jgi:chromosome segregation ATPase